MLNNSNRNSRDITLRANFEGWFFQALFSLFLKLLREGAITTVSGNEFHTSTTRLLNIHKNPEVFQEQDKKLQLAIQVINVDLERSRKHRRSSKCRTSFCQYLDGIHSGDTLSKLWLRRISEIIKHDCY